MFSWQRKKPASGLLEPLRDLFGTPPSEQYSQLHGDLNVLVLPNEPYSRTSRPLDRSVRPNDPTTQRPNDPTTQRTVIPRNEGSAFGFRILYEMISGSTDNSTLPRIAFEIRQYCSALCARSSATSRC